MMTITSHPQFTGDVELCLTFQLRPKITHVVSRRMAQFPRFRALVAGDHV